MDNRNLYESCVLHFVIVHEGPICLIDYNEFHVNPFYTLEMHVVENRPRAYNRISKSIRKYVVIHKQWLKELHCQIKDKHNIWAGSREFIVVDVWKHNNQPYGFCGSGWQELYRYCRLQDYGYVVFMHYYTDVSVFNENGSEVKISRDKNIEIFSHNKIIFPHDIDLMYFDHGQRINVDNFRLMYPDGTWFERSITKSVAKKRTLTIEASFVRRFMLQNSEIATVRVKEIHIVMELKAYEDKDHDPKKQKEHVVGGVIKISRVI